MTDNAEREAFKKVLPCHPDVYWHETMKRWVTNGAYLLEAHAYHCQWQGFQAGRAVAQAEEPVAYRFTENCGNGKVEYSYYDADKVAEAYRDNCLEITPLYTSPPLPADSVVMSRDSTPLETAAKWVLNDAMYKAPEQIGEVPSRWLERLRDAISVTDKGETK